MSSTKWTAAELPSFTGRTVVITGGNSGLGLETAKALAAAGAHVVITARDPKRGRDAAVTIGGDVEVRPLDLADLASVRAFAEGWSGDLDVLVNNAGLMNVPKSTTTDGFETQFGVDHLGPFALTNLLLPHITDRVVTVSSTLHRSGTIDFDDLQWEKRKYERGGAYGQAKLANLLFTSELQRRLTAAGSTVRSVAAHPGYASTNLQTRSGSALMDLSGRIANVLVAQSAEAGARPTLYATSQDLPGGSFVGPDGFKQLRGYPTLVDRSAEAEDHAVAAKLWTESERLTGVAFPLTGQRA